jgi:hypothetical protein
MESEVNKSPSSDMKAEETLMGEVTALRQQLTARRHATAPEQGDLIKLMLNIVLQGS